MVITIILRGEEKMSGFIFPAIIVVIVLIVLSIPISAYKKVAPNEVLIVTGGWLSGPYVQENEETHTKVKVIKGGGAFVIPIVQQSEIQSLDTFNVDVVVKNVMTKGMVKVNASANAVLRVGSTPKMIAIASEKMLGLSEEERDNQMQQVVYGGVREVLSGLTPSQANDRSQFRQEVVSGIEETFANLGLEITAFQIKDIWDDEGYFDSLSAEEVANKKSKARQAQAIADKEATLVEAQNNQEAQKAQLAADKQIAENQRDTDVAKAQFDAQVKRERAISENAYKIANAEQDQIINEKLILVKENELKATVLAQQKADAEAIGIKAQAEANKTKTLADANAEQIRKEGQAQADAQRALAKALENNGQFALQKAIIDNLPAIAASFADSVANIDNLTVFDGTEGVGRQSVAGLAQTLEFTKQATGIDVAELMQNKSEGKVTLNQPVPTEEQ
ncbi:inner membrane protein yqik [Ligilactobacillus equi DSM 15833 = JCM 10991]|nr:inner membrane protein yqik [Ligilactobacillus equi DSM 15833 = JCM 10991]